MVFVNSKLFQSTLSTFHCSGNRIVQGSIDCRQKITSLDCQQYLMVREEMRIHSCPEPEVVIRCLRTFWKDCGRQQIRRVPCCPLAGTEFATKANKVFSLNSVNPTNVIDMVTERVMIGPASQQAAEIGRQFTNCQMPW